MRGAGSSTDASVKRMRAHDAGSDTGGLDGDRLSDLPDALLHAIMSFMRARQVVQTCVLSKRWRHLWRSVPCLDVDHREFDPFDETREGEVEEVEEEQEEARTDEEIWESFKDFDDILMSRRNIARLDAFRLHVSCENREDADGWIRRGIKQNRNVPWRLKSLHLSNVCLKDLLGGHISAWCPLLEDLELRNCSYILNEIASGSLKKLVVDGTHELHHSNRRQLIIMRAPALASLRVAVEWNNNLETACCFLVHDASSLINASVQLPWGRVGDIADKKQLELLGNLSNVTSLELSNFRLMVLDEGSQKFPVFRNLTNLSLDDCDLSDNFQILVKFLLNSPNLEKLTLRNCKLTNHRRRGKSSPLCQNMADVQCKNLKLTEIIHTTDDAHLLVEFLSGISANLPKNSIKLNRKRSSSEALPEERMWF